MSLLSSFLSRDIGGEPIQAMPLRKGFVNLESPSVVIKPRVIQCVVAGDVTITWNDGTSDPIALEEGNSFSIDFAKSLLVESGTKIHATGKSVS